MTRVKAVVNRSIMVHLHDVEPGDILSSTNSERDPIIHKVERDGDKVKFHYLRDGNVDHMVTESLWLDPNQENSGHIFIHDIWRERFGYFKPQAEANRAASSGESP